MPLLRFLRTDTNREEINSAGFPRPDIRASSPHNFASRLILTSECWTLSTGSPRPLPRPVLPSPKAFGRPFSLPPATDGEFAVSESNAILQYAADLNPKPSGKVPDTHSIGSISDHDLGVFTVTNIATENTDAVTPAHPVPRTPKAANQGLHICRAPSVPLTCLAPLAAWQALCTGHVDASLENSVHWPSPTGTARAAVADTSVSPALERTPP